MNTMNPTIMPTVQTPRLLIDPLTLNDIKQFYAHRTHPDVLRYQGLFPCSEEDVHESIVTQNRIPFGTVNHWFQFAVRLNPENKFIGEIGLHFSSPFLPQMEIGYSIMPAFQHKGFAAESVQALISYCSSTLNMKIISATIDVRNTASQRLLQKMGFKRISYRPHASYLRGEWCDEADYVLFLNKYPSMISITGHNIS